MSTETDRKLMELVLLDAFKMENIEEVYVKVNSEFVYIAFKAEHTIRQINIVDNIVRDIVPCIEYSIREFVLHGLWSINYYFGEP